MIFSTVPSCRTEPLRCIYLADRANENNECWPAIPTIAADLKYSQSTVRRGICDLKKAGLLETEQRYRKKRRQKQFAVQNTQRINEKNVFFPPRGNCA